MRKLALAGVVLFACAGPEKRVQSPEAPTDRPVVSAPDMQGRVCVSNDPAAERAFAEAFQAGQAGREYEAIQHYRDALSLDPDLCDAMDNLGRIYRRQGKEKEAVALYERSLWIAPQNQLAIQNLAVAYEALGRTDEAEALYRKLIQLAPDNPEGHFGLATLAYDLGDYKSALKPLNAARELYLREQSPYLRHADYFLGLSYMALQDYTSARPYLEEATDDEDLRADPTLNFALGVIFANEPNLDEERARRYFERARDAGSPDAGEMLRRLDARH